MVLLALVLLLAGCQAGPGPARVEPPASAAPVSLRSDSSLKLSLQDGRQLAYQAPEPPALLVSTSSLAVPGRHPIREIALTQAGGTFQDADAPDGVTCYYRLRLGERVSNEVAIAWPDRPLPSLEQPSLLVDKSRFFLEVQDKGKRIKRYPIAMGKKHHQRKVCYDNASTPEGRYRIIALQPEATYYRAYDIDYPNEIDRLRYDFFKRNGLLEGGPDIGGEIQIHGKGIHANWTFGCMALRNEDMDELFAHPEIAEGTSVTIVGQELGLEDLKAIEQVDPEQVKVALQRELGPEADFDPESLGRFQLAKKLPVTCQADRRTLEALGL